MKKIGFVLDDFEKLKPVTKAAFLRHRFSIEEYSGKPDYSATRWGGHIVGLDVIVFEDQAFAQGIITVLQRLGVRHAQL